MKRERWVYTLYQRIDRKKTGAQSHSSSKPLVKAFRYEGERAGGEDYIK